MRIKYTNEAIMDVLLDGGTSMKYCILPDGRYLFSDEGIVAYILAKSEIFFSLDKCHPHPFDYLQERRPPISMDHLITPTMDVRVGKRGVLLTRLKAAGWDTFVDMDLLEAFDYPNFYQSESPGIIAITEGTAGTPQEVVRGYVMPVRTGLEFDHRYNDGENAKP